MKNEIRAIFQESARVRDEFLADNVEQIVEIVHQLIKVINRGDKILLFGNGGSAADCQHIAAEFVNRYRIERRPLPALALTTDTSVLTAIGNDYAFEDVFAKQIAALGRKGDAANRNKHVRKVAQCQQGACRRPAIRPGDDWYRRRS